jgi:hypothetical protein
VRLFKSRILSDCVRSEGGPCRSVTHRMIWAYELSRNNLSLYEPYGQRNEGSHLHESPGVGAERRTVSCMIILSALSRDPLAELAGSEPPDTAHEGLCESSHQLVVVECCRLTSIAKDSVNLLGAWRASSTVSSSSVKSPSVSKPLSSTSGV